MSNSETNGSNNSNSNNDSNVKGGSTSSSSGGSSLKGTITPKDVSKFDPSRVLNLNVGVLGHVDSGKTSLVKTLSTLLSTASLDKSSQSRQRGITLDLGFSAFLMPLPPSISDNQELVERYDLLQVTLVDCPGHASLIRTIIGGAQIIDMVLLVIDANKGIQTQTAECLVIAEMTTQNLVVVLNKIDLLGADGEERDTKLKNVKGKIRGALQKTRFKDAPMVGISACVGGEKVAATKVDEAGGSGSATNTTGKGNHNHSNHQETPETMNLQGLLDLLNSKIQPPNRDQILNSKFHFSIDHCFPIKGQGTVFTGTCLAGSIKVNEMVEFPTLSLERKVKSMQMFRRKVLEIKQGDRAGICVSNLDPKLMERGVAASPGSVKLISGAIAVVKKIVYFKGGLGSGTKFHISVGHTTVMATVTFWGAKEIDKRLRRAKSNKSSSTSTAEANGNANTSQSKKKSKDDEREELKSSSLGGNADIAGLPHLNFDIDEDFLQQDDYLEKIDGEDGEPIELPLHWAMIDFQTPVYCPVDSLIIGSRLDSDVQSNCRLAFAGRLVQKFDVKNDMNYLKLYTRKEKYGVICRLGDPFKRNDDGKIVRYEVYGSDLFKKETNMTQFVGLHLETERGDIGVIHSSFGTSGKFKVNFPSGVEARHGEKLFLRFKRYSNDVEKKIRQDSQLPPERCGSRIQSEKEKKKQKKAKKQTEKAKANKSKVVGKIASIKGEPLANGNFSTVIVEGFFSPEINVREKIGMVVRVIQSGEQGSITGSFGKAGKCKVSFPEGVPEGLLGAAIELIQS